MPVSIFPMNAAGLILAGVMVSVLLYSGASFFDNANNMKPSSGSQLSYIQGNNTAQNVALLKISDFAPFVLGALALLAVLAAVGGQLK